MLTKPTSALHCTALYTHTLQLLLLTVNPYNYLMNILSHFYYSEQLESGETEKLSSETPYHNLSPSSSNSSGTWVQSPDSWNEETIKLASSTPKKPAGRKKFRETRHPVYRGVRRRDSGKWVCEMREPNSKTRIWLGTHPTAEMAARAHDVASIALRGRNVCLNFADSKWRLSKPESADVKDIQKAAAEAAAAFRPQANGKNSGVVMENQREAYSTNKNNKVFYLNNDTDEDDEIFGMQGLLADMAEGMMLPPPPSCVQDNSNCDDEMEFDQDISLWSYSF